MALKNDKFPASAAFDAIQKVFESDAEARKAAIADGDGIYAFKLKNGSGDEESWHIDLKEEGKVGTGLGNSPTVTISVSEENFGKLVDGKANAQRLFMTGKVKVKGNVMKATKLDGIFAGLRDKSEIKAKL